MEQILWGSSCIAGIKRFFYGPEVVSLESESFYHKVSSVLSSSYFCLNENLSMLVSEERHKRLTTNQTQSHRYNSSTALCIQSRQVDLYFKAV